jgi:hypothetical protein
MKREGEERYSLKKNLSARSDPQLDFLYSIAVILLTPSFAPHFNSYISCPAVLFLHVLLKNTSFIHSECLMSRL